MLWIQRVESFWLLVCYNFINNSKINFAGFDMVEEILFVMRRSDLSLIGIVWFGLFRAHSLKYVLVVSIMVLITSSSSWQQGSHNSSLNNRS